MIFNTKGGTRNGFVAHVSSNETFLAYHAIECFSIWHSVGISDSWASLWSFINEAPRHGYSLLLVYEKSRRNTNVLALSLEWGHDIFYHQHPWKDRNEPIKPQLSWTFSQRFPRWIVPKVDYIYIYIEHVFDAYFSKEVILNLVPLFVVIAQYQLLRISLKFNV